MGSVCNRKTSELFVHESGLELGTSAPLLDCKPNSSCDNDSSIVSDRICDRDVESQFEWRDRARSGDKSKRAPCSSDWPCGHFAAILVGCFSPFIGHIPRKETATETVATPISEQSPS